MLDLPFVISHPHSSTNMLHLDLNTGLWSSMSITSCTQILWQTSFPVWTKCVCQVFLRVPQTSPIFATTKCRTLAMGSSTWSESSKAIKSSFSWQIFIFLEAFDWFFSIKVTQDISSKVVKRTTLGIFQRNLYTTLTGTWFWKC